MSVLRPLSVFICICLISVLAFAHGHDIDPEGVSQFVRSYLIHITPIQEGVKMPVSKSKGQPIEVNINGKPYVMYSGDYIEALIHSLQDASRFVKQHHHHHHDHHHEHEKSVTERERFVWNGMRSDLEARFKKNMDPIDIKVRSWAAEYIANRGSITLGMISATWVPYTIATEGIEASMLGPFHIACHLFQILYWSQINRFIEIFKINHRTYSQGKGGFEGRGLHLRENLQLMQDTLTVQKRFLKAWLSVMWVDIKNTFTAERIKANLSYQTLRLVGIMPMSEQVQTWLNQKKQAYQKMLHHHHEVLEELGPEWDKYAEVWSALYSKFLARSTPAQKNAAQNMMSQSDLDVVFEKTPAGMKTFQMEQATIHVESMDFGIKFMGRGLTELALKNGLPIEQVEAFRTHIGEIRKQLSLYRAALMASVHVTDPEKKALRRQVFAQVETEYTRLLEMYHQVADRLTQHSSHSHERQRFVELPSIGEMEYLVALIESTKGNNVENMKMVLNNPPVRPKSNAELGIPDYKSTFSQDTQFKTAVEIQNTRDMKVLLEELQKYGKLHEAERNRRIQAFRTLTNKIYVQIDPLPLEQRVKYLNFLAQVVREMEGNYFRPASNEFIMKPVVTMGGKMVAALFLAKLGDCIDDLGKLDYEPLLHFITHLDHEFVGIMTFAAGGVGGGAVFEFAMMLKNKIHARMISGGAMQLAYNRVHMKYNRISGYAKPQMMSLAREFAASKAALIGGVIMNHLLWGDPNQDFGEILMIEVASMMGAEVVVKGGRIFYRLARTGKMGWHLLKASTGIQGVIILAAELYVWEKLKTPIMNARAQRNVTGALGRSLMRFMQSLQHKPLSNSWDEQSDLCASLESQPESFQLCMTLSMIPLQVANYLNQVSMFSFYEQTLTYLRQEHELDDRYNVGMHLANFKLLKRRSFVDATYKARSRTIKDNYRSAIAPEVHKNKIDGLMASLTNYQSVPSTKHCDEASDPVGCAMTVQASSATQQASVLGSLDESMPMFSAIHHILQVGSGMQLLDLSDELTPQKVFESLWLFGDKVIENYPQWESQASYMLYHTSVMSLMQQWQHQMNALEHSVKKTRVEADVVATVIPNDQFQNMTDNELCDVFYEATGNDVFGYCDPNSLHHHTKDQYAPDFIKEEFHETIRAIYDRAIGVIVHDDLTTCDSAVTDSIEQGVSYELMEQGLVAGSGSKFVVDISNEPTYADNEFMVHVFRPVSGYYMTPALLHRETVYAQYAMH